MKITGRQIVTAAVWFLWLLGGAVSWYAVIGSTPFVDAKGIPTWQGFCFVPGAIIHGGATVLGGVSLLIELWDKNPTFEFPRKEPLPKATARDK